MAMEAKNKRKRKHQSTQPDGGEAQDEGEEEVPKKLAKKIKQAKDSKKHKNNKNQQPTDEEQQAQAENGEGSAAEGDSNDVNEEREEASDWQGTNQENTMQEHDSGYEEKELKFSKDFKMLHFRTKLRSDNFITELRHFLHMVHTQPKWVAKYIEKRGKPLELAEALERVDKSNVLHIGYLCQALQLVLMEIVSNQKEHMESAVYAARYFLKSHGNVVDQLLKSAQLQHRRIALKLLTTIVCVDPQLGRQLLASYDILSNVKTIENMLSHSHLELRETDTVRKCFIHFVLAYLVDGNTLLIRNILDRGALIRALASGLQYDDHVTVSVVVSTLRKYVLECAEISKTKKIHVFDAECCRHFLRLYDWFGPKVYAAKNSGKNGAQTQLRMEQIEALVNAEERAAVVKVVHEFMLLLLTSRKYGICFDAVTHYKEKHNALQGKLVGQLYKPWCDERKTELIIRILTACPELARHTVRHFAGVINPMRTPTRDWVSGCNFLAKIISTVQPQLLSAALDKITLTDCTYFIKDVCLPIETLALVTGAKFLRHKDFRFRLATNRLLYTMFWQYSAYITAIAKREEARGNANSLRRFRLEILNHILVNFPTVEEILFSLYMSIKDQGTAEVNVLEHLDVSLDLVLVICKEHRSFVNKTNTILDYLELLRPLYAGEETSAIGADAINIKLELKAIKTILLLLPKALEPNEKLFSSVLRSFIKAFVYGSGEVRVESGALLRKIFLNTGLFDSGVWEVDLWLEALRFFDAQTVDVVTQVFIASLQVTKVDVEMPKTTESILNEQNLQKLFENIENGLSVQAYVESISISKLMPLIFKGVEISAPLNKYLETVCLLLYHYYPNPEQVVQLYKQQFKTFEKYMRSWLPASDKELPLSSAKMPAELHTLGRLHDALVQGDAKLAKIFAKSRAEEQPLEVTLGGEAVALSAELKSERLVMIYVQQVLFVVAQLVEKQRLTRKQAEAAANFLGDCLELVSALVGDEQAVTTKDGLDGNFLNDLFKYIFNLRLTRIQTTALFSAHSESQLSYLHFLRLLTERSNAHTFYETHALNCRLKVVKAIAISMQTVDETKAASEQLTDAVRLVRALQLRASECIEVLDSLVTQLKCDDFVLADTLQKSIYYELLVCVLQRLAALRQAVQCDNFVRKFKKLYVNFVKRFGTEMGFEQLEEALHDFLCVAHQYIPQLGAKFFGAFFAERRLAKPTIKLAGLLLKRDERLDAVFVQLLPDNMNKKELVYPLLDIAFHKQCTLDPALLQNIYQSFKSGFMKTIEKPQKAGVIYKEHAGTSIALIERCMPRSECVDFCNKSFKFDGFEVYQLRLIHAIYKKAYGAAGDALSNDQQRASIFVNFVSVLIQLLSIELRKQQLDAEKLEFTGFLLYDWWQHAHTKCASVPVVAAKKGAEKKKRHATAASADVENEDMQQEDAAMAEGAMITPDFSKLLQNQQWINFCKFCLKLGMQHVTGDDAAPQQLDATNALLLKLLGYLCQQLYVDYSADTHAEPPLAEPAQLFDMICTHSKFFDIVLSPRETQVKTQVLHLLYTLALKNPAALSDAQIPVILGAYQAKLSDADRYALALLQLYEVHECGLEQYRPFIWGESAIAFYALRAADEERAKLTQQETSIAQVMSLIDRQLCDYTIDNFPIWRKLNSAQQLPTVEFCDPTMKAFEFGSNELERRIERGCTQFEEAELRLFPVRARVYTQCYDPAFFVPLMNMCFAPEAYSHPARPVQNGLLALVFAALSSQDRDMRLAAGCVQLRYRAHFEANKFFERPLWLQAYDNIQAGLSELRDSWVKHKKNSGTPRVPFISGLFVAKTFNLTADPTHLLYKQLTMYLRLKSTFNFQCVPEFNVLFYSPEIEHQAFRQFIVEVIRNGIKSGSDLFLLVTTNTFKVLQGFYGSAMSTLDMNLLILSVFSTCAKIPASSKVMIEHVGLLPWLNSVMSTVEFYQFDIIEGLISTLSNLWYSVKSFASEFHNFAHITLELHQLVLRLLPHLSARISPHNFARLMNILQKTSCGQHRAMSEAQLANLIECAGKHYPTLIQNIEGIKAFGGAGAAALEDYCRELHEAGEGVDAIMALSSLRAYTIDWWQSRHAQEVESGELATADLNETAAD
ncbi:nucleolar pre-ribosomal-associated protein 1 [Anastrepha ludens]|uniref:nucleolar pre-ribosomal-associated protein 1 n=1 Tax=Anastrepha ludens TaxID=28586 RepID=UPI0023B12EA7|nr:nucleolar pre-ribosomal-associated protein 1 [Anastrepha ludens]